MKLRTVNAPACPHCRKPIVNATKLAGKKVKCAKCGGKYRVPAAAGGKIEEIFDLDEAIKPRGSADPSAETSVPTREMPAVPATESPDEASSKVQPVPVQRGPGGSGARERIRRPTEGGAEGNRFTGRPEAYAGLVLVVAFFLPWYSVLGRSVNGLLYLIPAGGVVALVVTLAMPRRSSIGPMIGGGLALLGVGYFVSYAGLRAFSFASIGFHLTLCSIVALLILPFIKLGRK